MFFMSFYGALALAETGCAVVCMSLYWFISRLCRFLKNRLMVCVLCVCVRAFKYVDACCTSIFFV